MTFNPNVRPSDRVQVLAACSPVSQAAGSYTSGWLDASQFEQFLAVILSGTLGASATIDANIQQAKDSAGTGAKAIGSGKAIAQWTTSPSKANVEALINLRAEELDMNNGFSFIQLTVTVGVAASEISAVLLGFDPRYETAQPSSGAAVVDQVI